MAVLNRATAGSGIVPFDLQARLAERRAQQLFRQRLSLDSPSGPLLRIAGREFLTFCSNDYLGLANHPQLIQALQQGAQRWGVGAGAAHLVTGHSRPHQALEEALAAFTGRSRALLFSTGYMANLAAVTALLGKGDTVLEDRLNHASLLDGGLLSGARFARYRHSDMDSLERHLQRAEGRTLVVTDGVFSMDGDLAVLPALYRSTQACGAWLMVDDAHGLGVLGERGAGICEHFSASEQNVPVLVGTLGKAFGSAGAFVAGSEALIETLIQFARPYIYTTAQPPALACATLKSLELIQAEGWRRTHLQNLIRQFRQGAAQIGLPLLDSPTPIQPLLLGGSGRALQLAGALRERGVLVSAIRPPTVPTGSARLRITLSAAHTEQQVQRLLTALAEAWPQVADDE